MQVVGLGTQDDPDQAVDFVEQGGNTSFPMLWDESFETWSAFGISAQPAAVLLAGDGSVLGGWLGPFPEDEVLRLAAS